MGLVAGIKGIGDKPVGSTVKEELTDKQKKLDVDKDGEIEGSDLAKLRAKKEEIGPKDTVDSGEYDYEGDMAKNQLQTIIRNAQMLHDMLADDTNLPEWVQNKISLAKEYTESAAQYISSEKDQNGTAEVPGAAGAVPAPSGTM
jgi:hypothetical protein